ncbi:MAG: homoserine O-acetyltransferase [Actinobacteria bacterium]|nr:homoserine O-acetyltransferase [Actinomycetota bacterium]
MSIGPTTTQFFTFGSPSEPFQLRSGAVLDEVTLAYETYGTLNEDRSNAVLLFHALTGSHHAAGITEQIPDTDDRWTEELRLGWWDNFIGPGRAIDTDRFFVICANYIGGCYGSTGPTSTDPRTGKPYGSSFPVVGFTDVVDSQIELLRHLGIERLHAVVGGSTGGVCAISLATRFPDLVGTVIPIAAGSRPTPLQIIHNFEQINAIQNDPNFAGGDYYDGPPPTQGLRLARMIGHKTFVSLEAMQRRAREEIVALGVGPGTYDIQHPMESYMWHQGRKFVDRFDANSYLRMMVAWQRFDLAAEAGVDDLSDLFTPCKHQRYMVFTIDSDVCFYPDEQSELMRLLGLADVPARRITVHSDKGHDSFLLEPALYAPHLADTLLNEWTT